MSVVSPLQGVSEFLLAGKDRNAVALLTLKQQHTYGELQSAALQVAAFLLNAGAKKGDRALLIGDNSFFWVAAYLGILQVGLISVPLPPSISPEDLAYTLETTEARLAFLQRSTAQQHAALFSDVTVVVENSLSNQASFGGSSPFTFADLCAQSAGLDLAFPLVEENDLAALMFTSGSTGAPRGVMVSHANIMANTESIIEYLELSGSDRIMAVLPFHYCFGTSLLHTHLKAGGTVVIDGRFLYPEKILDRMIETGCTGFAGVPSHYQILLHATSLRQRHFPQLRYVQQAGGRLPVNFIRELEAALPDARLFIMYGQTEATARLSYLPPERLGDKLGSIGRGIPGVRLRVLNESGEDVVHGETGEVVAEGRNVTRGYWRDPEETAKYFRNGRLHTGDLATIDEEGFIFIVDRAKDFIKCGGKRISCLQLEHQILQFEGLVEAAVIGVPDEILGEAVKVFVVPGRVAPDLVKHLFAFCKEHMPAPVVPREIVVLDALPKNSAGKVSKRALRAL